MHPRWFLKCDLLFDFISGQSLPLHTMPRFFSQLALPVKVAVSCFAIVYLIIYYNMNYMALPSHIPVAGVVRGSNSDCPAGFYTKEELKPHLRRPLQDPRAPGANGEPFVSHIMTREERKEKLQGFMKNQFNQFASDRISLHRDLGKDTRHPEWVSPLFINFWKSWWRLHVTLEAVECTF